MGGIGSPQGSSTRVIRLTVRRDWVGLVVLVLICLGAGAIGSWFTTPALDSWYASLRKPAWNPPNWVFGPVWSALYLLMATAAWLVWRVGGIRARGGAMGLFAVQLILNVAWSALFFGLQRPGAAFGGIVALWIAIVLTVVAFARTSRTSAWLMIPYLAWVTFAGALNLAIWWLNS